LIFELTEKQLGILKEWQENIKVSFGTYGDYTYSFTPTIKGNYIKVHSSLTKKELHLTDFDAW